mgnify:CR=1 FL=1
MSYFAARQAQTTLSCPECDHKLEIARTCHEAFMRCPFCGKPLVLNDIWLKRGNTGYYTEATCPDHGPWFLRFKLNRRDGLHWNFARCIETVRPESYSRYKKLEKSQRERIRMKAERAGKKTQE